MQKKKIFSANAYANHVKKITHARACTHTHKYSLSFSHIFTQIGYFSKEMKALWLNEQNQLGSV